MKKMPARILYVEDDESARWIVKDQLTNEGFDVRSASDGAEATDILQKESFDLLLLDIRMPRKDGMEVLRFMKKNKIHPRVIMLTAVGELSIAIEAVKLGANDYLTKPYSLEELLACIQRVLAR